MSLGETSQRLRQTNGSDDRLEEIDGLRALCALLVASYHIWFQRVSGGVDVFFVVAAYFATRTLAGRATTNDLRELIKQTGDFYAATARRLAPAIGVVILATSLISIWLMPAVLWPAQRQHAWSSAGSVENVRLWRDAVDYLSQGLESSPFQHFWAVSLQVQFFVALPMLVLACSAIARRSAPRLLIFTVALVVAFSFIASLRMTAGDQAIAYYHPVPRAWEFGVGSLLALWLHGHRPRGRLVEVFGWIALGVLITFAALIDVSTTFPGAGALVPVLAASWLILTAHGGVGPMVLRRPALRALASISFAFYLWHWPVLIFYRYRSAGDEAIGLLPGVAILVAAGLLSWATTTWLERPFRRWSWAKASTWRTALACTFLLAPCLVAIATWGVIEKRQIVQAEAARKAFLTTGLRPAGSDVVPNPVIARADLAPAYADGCHQRQRETQPNPCSYGSIGADRVIALVGGSHSVQWLAALELYGSMNGYEIRSLTRAGCALGDPTATGTFHPSCQEWVRNVLRYLVDLKPDLVITTATQGVGSEEHVPLGYLRHWRVLTDRGIRIMALRDNPRFPFDVPRCVNIVGTTKCSVPRTQLLNDSLTFGNVDDRVHIADLTDVYCDEQVCDATRDGVLLYRDRHHLTNTFVLTLVDRFSLEVQRALGLHTAHPDVLTKPRMVAWDAAHTRGSRLRSIASRWEHVA